MARRTTGRPRSGVPEVWAMARDGSDARQITRTDGGWIEQFASASR